MENGLYHREVYWTDDIQKQIDVALNSGLQFQFSNHAIDKEFIRQIPTSSITIDKLKNGECFEVLMENNKVIKFVIRYGFDDIYDLSSVWIPNSDCLFCKTIWLNKKTDKHKTLDKKNYVTYKSNEIQHISSSIGEILNYKLHRK